MDFYPAEVATPPLALVALLGCQSLHGIIGEFLRAAQKPPINSLGIGDPAMAARVFGAKKSPLVVLGVTSIRKIVDLSFTSVFPFIKTAPPFDLPL